MLTCSHGVCCFPQFSPTHTCMYRCVKNKTLLTLFININFSQLITGLYVSIFEAEKIMLHFSSTSSLTIQKSILKMIC